MSILRLWKFPRERLEEPHLFSKGAVGQEGFLGQEHDSPRPKTRVHLNRTFNQKGVITFTTILCNVRYIYCRIYY